MSNLAQHVNHGTCNSKLHFVTCYLFTLLELLHLLCAYNKNKWRIKFPGMKSYYQKIFGCLPKHLELEYLINNMATY